MDSSSPRPSQRHSGLLRQLLNNRDWPRALEAAYTWLEEDPLNTRAHHAAGTALVNLERYPEAASHLAHVLARRPDHASAHQLASITCFHRKEFTQADKHIQRAIELQPNDSAHWYHLAWMRHQQGRRAEAVRHAKRAQELAPEASHIVNLLALCEPGDAFDLLRGYRRALELDPESSVVYNNLGAYYLNVDGDYEAAADAFRQALRIDPHNRVARSNLATVFRKHSFVYQLLRLPRQLLTWSLLLWKTRHWFAMVLLAIFWVVGARGTWPLVTGGLALLYAPSKLYEFLTLPDLHAWMGVPGARRGGLLGYHAWPFAVRMATLALFTLLYWYTLGVLTHTAIFLHYAHQIPGVGEHWF